MRLALLALARRARHLWNAALEEFAKDRRQPFEFRNLRGGPTCGHFLLGTDVDDRWRGIFNQRRKIRQSRLRLRHHGLPEQGQACHEGKAAVSIEHDYKSPH